VKPQKRKRQTQTELPELCAAVKSTRSAWGQSQQAFSQLIGVSLVSISKFELGTPPKDRQILSNLTGAANMKGLTHEARLFSDAALAAPRARRWEDAYPVPHQMTASDMPTLMARIWRLIMAAQTAIYHPESLPDMEAAWDEAGSWPLAVVDEVTKDAGDPREWDQFALGLRVRELAQKKASAEFQQRKRSQEK
jgi:transcriptional regulator with XRE-family HTH domain